MKKVLIVDNEQKDWFKIFADKTLSNGEEIEIDQSAPNKIHLKGYSNKKLSLDLMPYDSKSTFSQQNDQRQYEPDIILFRRVSKKLLIGFQYANTPCINSLESIFFNLERPWVYGSLRSIRDRLGADNFPLIEQYYYPDHWQMRIAPNFPIIIKVGAAHAGFGKIKLNDYHQFEDFASVMALSSDYITAEPFIQADYDIRIQKIGNQYREFRRKISINWKANQGGAVLEDLEVSDTHKKWIDECSMLYGGMDILALDILHTREGKEWILELNDCQIGFPPIHEEEDMKAVVNLVIKQLEMSIGG